MSEEKLVETKISEFWGQSTPLEERKLVAWMEHPRVIRHINKRTTGDETLTWFSYIGNKYFQNSVNRALSIGCGEGGLERHALAQGMVELFDAIDISQGAIEKAQQAAKKAGFLQRVNYSVSDLNQLTLTPNFYDAVFASMSIHHIEALELVFEQISQALRTGRYFIFNEYVGPNRFQLPEERITLINDTLKILPSRFRRFIQNGIVTPQVKIYHKNPPLLWFEENDPSEAVRSADILPVLEKFFEIIEFKPYGGSLLQFMLQDIVGNFTDGEDDDDAWLDMVMYFEKVLEETGVIQSDFVLVVAVPKHHSF